MIHQIYLWATQRLLLGQMWPRGRQLNRPDVDHQYDSSFCTLGQGFISHENGNTSFMISSQSTDSRSLFLCVITNVMLSRIEKAELCREGTMQHLATTVHTHNYLDLIFSGGKHLATGDRN